MVGSTCLRVSTGVLLTDEISALDVILHHFGSAVWQNCWPRFCLPNCGKTPFLLGQVLAKLLSTAGNQCHLSGKQRAARRHVYLDADDPVARMSKRESCSRGPAGRLKTTQLFFRIVLFNSLFFKLDTVDRVRLTSDNISSHEVHCRKITDCLSISLETN